TNGTSMAKAAGKRVHEAQVTMLSDDCGLIGFNIMPVFTQDLPDGPIRVAAVLTATGGRMSQIVGSFEPRTVVVAEVFSTTVENLREQLMPLCKEIMYKGGQCMKAKGHGGACGYPERPPQ